MKSKVIFLVFILSIVLALPSTPAAAQTDALTALRERIETSGVLAESSGMPDSGTQRIFVSVSDGTMGAKVGVGAGESLEGALDNALQQLDKLWVSEEAPLWVKVDVVNSVETLENVDFNEPLPISRSLQGIALDWEAGLAFLPGESVARTLVDSDAELRFDNLNEYVPERFVYLEPLLAAEENMSADLDVFTTDSFFLENGTPVPLYRNHRTFEELSPDMLVEAAIQGGEYLTDAVFLDGAFLYSYLPKTDRINDGYNILRHAGTIYAMSELYALTGDAELKAAIDRAINYMMLASSPCPGQATGELHLCLVEDGEVKLGGNALAIVALVEYTKATGESRYMDVMQEYAAWIEEAQYENGSFVMKVQVETNTVDSFDSLYYPGEAILAMMRLYSLDGNERWLDVADKATRYLINVRDAGLETNQLIHDHWLLYGLNELYRERSEDFFMTHAMRITQSITNGQNLDPIVPDWFGSYYTPPRSTPAATRSEGLCAAYKLARDYDRPEDAERILTAMQNGIRFQLQTQFRPETALYLIDPQQAMGGFRRSLTNYEVRNDYVQHNISALLCAAEVLSE